MSKNLKGTMPNKVKENMIKAFHQIETINKEIKMIQMKIL